MSDQYILLCLILDRLDRVYHANILALLEGDLCQLELDEFQALLAQKLEELLGEAVSAASHLDGVFVPMASDVLEEVAQVALVRVVISSPLAEIRVSGQILAAHAVTTSVRVDVAVLEDGWLHVAVDRGDYTRLRLVDLIEAEVLWQVDDLRALQRERQVQIGVQSAASYCDEEVLVLQVPQYALGLSLEVRNHNQTLVDWVEHVSVARAVDADALSAGPVWEYLDKGILA